MPLTPFVGLSVFIHILIIFWHNLFNRHTDNGHLHKIKTTSFKRFAISAIVISIFILVISSAGMLVRASVEDKYSSINLTEHYVSLALNMSPHTNDLYVSDIYSKDHIYFDNKILSAASVVIPDKIMSSCTDSQVLASSKNVSIVSYLESKKQDSSFKARKFIAVSHGIKSYVGSRDQNLALLQQIISSQSCQS